MKVNNVVHEREMLLIIVFKFSFLKSGKNIHGRDKVVFCRGDNVEI